MFLSFGLLLVSVLMLLFRGCCLWCLVFGCVVVLLSLSSCGCVVVVLFLVCCCFVVVVLLLLLCCRFVLVYVLDALLWSLCCCWCCCVVVVVLFQYFLV